MPAITIEPFSRQHAAHIAEVLLETFPWCYNDEEVENSFRDFYDPEVIALIAVVDGRAVGIIAAQPMYGVTGWELHPLAVLRAYRGQGIGTALVAAMERAAAIRGGVTVYLGSDDEHGTTSLYGADLYDDTFGKIENIENINRHPYSFYQKCGYQIVGVLPDVNGIGKPDIFMAKRIV